MKRLLVALLLLGLLLAGLSFAGWRWVRSSLVEPRSFAPAGESKLFEVRSGESARSVFDRLEQDGLIGSARIVRLYHSRVLSDPAIQVGTYRFASPLSTLEMLRMLRTGEVATDPLTVIEGLTLSETADAIARAGFGERDRLLAEFALPGRIRDLDPEAPDLEGYLFPDTYRLPKGVLEARIADRLVAAFHERFTSDVRPLLAADDRRSVREIVILASLVEKEARLDRERPWIAAVYANRLRRGIGLYADPTIIHGLKLAGRWDGNLRRRDLEEDSPWNTYRNPGLPPGPIASPGLASLQAAARPADVPFLYFVSRNDGSHVFSETLAEHNRNVDVWQRQYFRRKR
ncbi:MAG: endolytic transglycosylase MltG [Thermoanaerobaculia bacterium]